MCIRPLLLVLLTLASPVLLGADIMAGRIYKAVDGETLPYRLFTPAGHGGKAKLPLVVFLFGNGHQGNSPEGFQAGNLFRFTLPEVQKEHPCFVMAPRCPKDQKWADQDWSKGSFQLAKSPTKGMRLTLEIIEALAKEFPNLDRDRIYVGGNSMGGYGTWDLILRHPELAAAAFPMCGAGDPSMAASIARLPIWTFHGDQDGVVPVRGTREMVAALKKAGGEPRYTEYPGVDHNCWDPAMNEAEFIPWLFAQKRVMGKGGKPTPRPGH